MMSLYHEYTFRDNSGEVVIMGGMEDELPAKGHHKVHLDHEKHMATARKLSRKAAMIAVLESLNEQVY